MNAADRLDALAHSVEQAYARVQRENMQGVPILNPRLQVRMLGLRAWKERALGVLITPWCMNLLALALPGQPALDAVAAGRTCAVDLPSGTYELLATHLPELGHHLAGSLFSPMQDFGSQPQALAAAQSALELLFAQPKPPDVVPSRRGFLFGSGRATQDTPA